MMSGSINEPGVWKTRDDTFNWLYVKDLTKNEQTNNFWHRESEGEFSCGNFVHLLVNLAGEQVSLSVCCRFLSLTLGSCKHIWRLADLADWPSKVSGRLTAGRKTHPKSNLSGVLSNLNFSYLFVTKLCNYNLNLSNSLSSSSAPCFS